MDKVDLQTIPVRILFINGSPDKLDRTEGLLDKAIDGARSLNNVDVHVYDFLGKEMYPCKGCVEYCLKNTRCVNKDSLHELINQWLKADGIVWGMPVYTFGTPVQVRSFIDRFGEQIFQSRWPERLPWWRFAKPIGTILNGSVDHGGLEFEALGLISHYILINAFHVPGDSLRASTGVIGRYSDGDTLADQPDVLQDAYRLGVRVTELSKLLLAGKYALASSLPDIYWCSKEDYKMAVRPEVR